MVDDCGQTCGFGELQTFVSALKFCTCEESALLGLKNISV